MSNELQTGVLHDMSDVGDEDDMREIVEQVEPGDRMRIHFVTGLPHQSLLQPEDQLVERLEDGRFRAQSFGGSPNHYELDEVVEELISLDHIRAVEVPA